MKIQISSMFGGGAGHVADMIARIKANEALRKNLHRRDRHFNMKNLVIKRRKNIKYNFPKASKALLRSIRRTAREDNRRDSIKRIFILIIAILLTAMIIGAIYMKVNK